MKYRIVEFKVDVDQKGTRFFVETGKVIWQKSFLFIFLPKTIWEQDVNETGQPIGYKKIEDAIQRIEDIKNGQPIYHEVK